MDLGVLEASLKLNISQFNTGIQKAVDGFKKIHNESIKLNQTFELLKNSFMTVARAALSSFDLIERGAKLADVATVFRNLANATGQSADAMLADMRRATNGYLNDLRAMSLATQSMIAGMNFEDVVVALSYLQKYAKATGKSFDQLTETIMTGMARGSVLMLDDAGIIIDAQSIINAKTKEYGRELTEVEKKQVVVSAAIEQMKNKMGALGGSTTSAYDAMQQLRTSWENFKNWLGTWGLKTVALVNVSIAGWKAIFYELQKLGIETKFVVENAFSVLKVTIGKILTSIMQMVQSTLFDLLNIPMPDFAKNLVKNSLTSVNKMVASLIHFTGKNVGEVTDRYFSGAYKQINKINTEIQKTQDNSQVWFDILTGKTQTSAQQFDLSPSVGVTTEATATKDVSNVIEDLRRKIDESTSAIENFGNKGGIELGKITAEYNQLIDKYKGNGKIIDLVNQWYNLEKQRIELQETDDYVKKIVEQQVAYEQTNKELERSIKLQQLNIADTTGFSAQIQQIIDKYDDLKEKNKDLADSFEELKQKEIEAITTLNRQKLETDLFDKYNSYLGDLEQAQMQYFASISPNAELQSKVLDAHFRYQQRIQEVYSAYANNPELIERATSFYTQLRDAEIQFAQDTTLTDAMQMKLAQVQGAFNAFYDVFNAIGHQLGTSLAQAFETGFNIGAFMNNLAKTLRAMAIQKTVTLIFEGTYQQIMAGIYNTLAISEALANPALSAAYAQAAIGARVASSGAFAGAAIMGSLATGLIVGMAHDGINYIPNDGTWLLQKGERVIDSKTNKDLTDFLKNQKQSNINMTVNINGGDEQGVLNALPKLKQTIIEVVSGDIVQNGVIRKTILSYT